MGLLGFFGDGGDFDVFETGGFEPAVELVLGEAEPVVSVEFVGLFEGVFLEVEDDEATSWLEDAEGFANGAVRMDGVVEGLAEEGEVDVGVSKGDFFDVA